MSTRPLYEDEILALFKMYDHHPAGREHEQMRAAYYEAARNMLGLSWFGRTRVYLSRRVWCLIEKGDEAGLWVKHEGKRVRVGHGDVRQRQKCGHVTLMAKPDFAEVVYVLSSGHEWAEGIMPLPVGETPAEFMPEDL